MRQTAANPHHEQRRQSTARRGAMCCMVSLTSALVGLCISGCAGRENATEDKGTDTAYLRVPGQKGSPSSLVVPLSSGPLFPDGVGSRWEMETMQGPWKPESGQSQSTIKVSRSATEVIKVTGQTTLGNQAGAVFDISDVAPPNTPGGTTIMRQEIYSVTQKGLFLLAAGGKTGQMTMSPPLPLMTYPPKEGECVQWNGVLHYKNATVPASSLSRVSGVQMVKTKATPKGVAAYRVDTIISTTLETGQVNFPTTRWLAPGIGMVRQKLIAGDQLVIKDLKLFEIAPK